MKLTLRAAHSLLLATARPQGRRFVEALQAPEKAWRERLHSLLLKAEQTEFGHAHGLGPRVRLEHVRARLPLTTWKDWEPRIEAQRLGGRPVVSTGCSRYRPTSGSTPIKWLPYPPAFQEELDAALSPWLIDLVRLEPGLMEGPHFVTLTWRTDSLRGQGAVARDDDFFPWWKQAALRAVRAIPEAVQNAGDTHARQLATLAWLLATPNLRLLSAWSPTFVLELLQLMVSGRDVLIESLRSGKWADSGQPALLEAMPCPRAPEAAAILQDWNGVLEPDVLRALWPDLCLLSTWDSGQSRRWAEALASLFPHTRFQGKGLWASEGVVTFPYEGAYVPAITSHLLEFRCLNTSRVLFPWELEQGQEVQPVISTAAGLWRYLLPDRLTVTGRAGALPTLKLEGRIGGVDLVGEKLSAERAEEVLDALCSQTQLAPIALVAYAPETGRPCYLALVSPVPPRAIQKQKGSAGRVGRASIVPQLSARLDALLCQAYHYRLARELSQLGPAQVVLLEDGAVLYRRALEAQGDTSPDMRIETLVTWNQLPFELEPLSSAASRNTECEAAARYIS